MNFELNDVQRSLQDSVARLLGDVYGFEQRRAIAAGAQGWSQTVWQQLSQLGVTTVPFCEAHGGFGGGAVDLLPVMQLFGKALLLEPFLASIVLGGTAVRRAADEATQAKLLPPVARGERRLAWAHDEEDGRHAPLWVQTQATCQDGQWRLSGSKCLVLHAGAAHHLVVSARLTGAPGDPQGLALFLVDVNAQGLHARHHRLVDDSSASELQLNAVPAQVLTLDAARAHEAIEATVHAGIAAVCADAVGAMEAAYALAVAYLNTRQQFGRLIGQNQALRHRAADMFVSLEMCRSMAMAAAVAADNPSSPDAHLDLLRAKLMIGRHGRQVCHAAIQLHGGIGMTEEYAVGHYLRRVTLLDQLFGDAGAQASRLAALLR